jgi:ADP-heptose:LPS heptosyltransferase
MSLPYLLELDTIEPTKEQYILVNNDKYMHWKERFSHMNRPKIGFVFNGLLSSIIEKNISLHEIKKLYDLNAELICICRLNEVKQNEYFDELKERVHFFDIDNDVPFEDTIAILQNIDILITVDTYIVHLAGVLGIKTFLLLGYTSDWRWSNKETTTYWYNSVELIRMKENKNMDNILVEVKPRIVNEIETS